MFLNWKNISDGRLKRGRINYFKIIYYLEKMNKRNILKNILVGIIFVFGISFIYVKKGNIAFNRNEAGWNASIVDDGIQPKASVTVWKYKEENGKMYMRLYDATNRVWLTDWILCS